VKPKPGWWSRRDDASPNTRDALLLVALAGTSEAATRRLHERAEETLLELADMVHTLEEDLAEAEKARAQAEEDATEAKRELEEHEDRMAEMPLEDVALAALLVQAIDKLLELPMPPRNVLPFRKGKGR
jgi:chromosome segregation ATPase